MRSGIVRRVLLDSFRESPPGLGHLQEHSLVCWVLSSLCQADTPGRVIPVFVCPRHCRTSPIFDSSASTPRSILCSIAKSDWLSEAAEPGFRASVGTTEEKSQWEICHGIAGGMLARAMYEVCRRMRTYRKEKLGRRSRNTAPYGARLAQLRAGIAGNERKRLIGRSLVRRLFSRARWVARPAIGSARRARVSAVRR